MKKRCVWSDTPFWYYAKLQQIQDESQQNKDACDPLGCGSQLCIQGLGLALAQEGFGTAADCAGQTCALAGLDGDDCDQSNCAKQLNCHNDIGESAHNLYNLQRNPGNRDINIQ